MLPVDSEWSATLASASHQVVTRLDVCEPDGTVLETITPQDGDVQVASDAAVRRTCAFTLAATPDLVPASISDLLSPLTGHELRPYRGLVYRDGTEVLQPLGVLPLRRCQVSTSGRVISLEGRDRSTSIARNTWTGPYSIADGTPVEEAILGILADRAPHLELAVLPATGRTVAARTLGIDSLDPWADAQQLATDIGLDLFFDQLGGVVLRSPTDPGTATPVVTYADDSAAMVIDAAKDWDSDTAFNGVIARGESADPYVPAAYAEVWDDDPTSPTYYRGDYGPYPETITSPNWASDEDAQVAATAQLARRRGVAQTLSWSQLVDPALDAGDAVRFTSAGLAISGLTVVIDSLTIPWTAQGLAAAGIRTQQVAA